MYTQAQSLLQRQQSAMAVQDKQWKEQVALLTQRLNDATIKADMLQSVAEAPHTADETSSLDTGYGTDDSSAETDDAAVDAQQQVVQLMGDESPEQSGDDADAEHTQDETPTHTLRRSTRNTIVHN
jgi:hypothetical protein